MMSQSSATPRKLDASELATLLGNWSDGAGPLYGRLADRVASLVVDGTLRAGDRLTPERPLANALAVSRGTVVKAFDRLTADGALSRVQGSGTTVNGNHVAAGRADAFVGDRLWSDATSSVDLLKAIPTVTQRVLDAVAATRLSDFTADLDSAEPLGWWPLRERIAALYSRYGVTTTPHQIMVTSGAQQGIALAVHALLHPGDVVLSEAYTWPGLIDAVQHVGARIEPVAMDADGIDVDDLERKVVRFRPALVSLNPQHQNPTGTRLSADRVAEVARIAREHRVTVVEDRVAADLAFDGRRLPFIDAHDTGGHGISVGSVCKVAWPGLRLGWMRADPQVVNRLRPHKAVHDMFSSSLGQAAATTILDDYDEFVKARVDELRSRADVVVDALRHEFPDWRFVPPRGGMCVWVALPAGVSSDAFVQHAARFGVQVGSCAQFSASQADTGHLRIPFTSPEDVLAEGMRRLADAWRCFDQAHATPAVI